jgi:transposase
MRGIRGKRVKTVKEGTLIVTIDVGMTTNTGYCTTTDGRDIKPFKFGNTREGLDKLWSMVVSTRSRFNCIEVIVGYESTGPYAEPLVQYLMDKPVMIVQVNPLHTKRIKELNDNSPRKTDDKDPRVIADVLRLGHALSVIVPEGDAAYLRRLNNARERHVGERTALLNQLQQLVFLIFPEFRTVFNDVTVKTALHLLKRYTTPEAIAVQNKDDLGEEIRKRSMGKFGMREAELLIGLARDTVGIREGVAGMVIDIRHILVQLQSVNGFIEEIETEMKKTLERIPSSARILSLHGLGVVTVGGLIGEVGDFLKFRTQSEIMKLAGLDLFEISSGKRKGQRHISKRGRSLLRKILYNAAVGTIRKNGIMCDYYERLIGRGMVRTSALIVIAKKLLRIIHAMMRDGRDYIPNYESPKRVVIKKAA